MNASDATVTAALPRIDAGLARMDAALREAVAAVQTAGRVTVNVEPVVCFPPAPFDAILARPEQQAAGCQGLLEAMLGTAGRAA